MANDFPKSDVAVTFVRTVIYTSLAWCPFIATPTVDSWAPITNQRPVQVTQRQQGWYAIDPLAATRKEVTSADRWSGYAPSRIDSKRSLSHLSPATFLDPNPIAPAPAILVDKWDFQQPQIIRKRVYPLSATVEPIFRKKKPKVIVPPYDGAGKVTWGRVEFGKKKRKQVLHQLAKDVREKIEELPLERKFSLDAIVAESAEQAQLQIDEAFKQALIVRMLALEAQRIEEERIAAEQKEIARLNEIKRKKKRQDEEILIRAFLDDFV